MSEAGGHPRHRLDAHIHTPVRLSLMAALSPADRVEFGYLRGVLEVSESLLSKHVSLLEAAGYVQVIKGYVGKRPRTWLRITPGGAAALERYIAALQEIVSGTAAPDAGPETPGSVG